jgi:TRAP transporter TAXI family solute receptor
MNLCTKLLIFFRKYFPKYIILYIGLIFFIGYPANGHSQNIYVTIGTGAVEGVYYPTGRAIAKIVNQDNNKHDLEVKYESTSGSVFNVNAIMAGGLEFGVVQSDRQYQAWNGIKDWKNRGPQKKLRSICSFYSESVVLVAGDDSGIETLNDIKGKVVNIGNRGSGPRGNAIDVMQACGIDWKRELTAEDIRAGNSAAMLQKGNIDAFFYTVGHPNQSIADAISGTRKSHFITLTGACIDKLVDQWPYYTRAIVPIRFYPQARNTQDIKSFGVKATLCTSEDMPDTVVYTITKQIFENLEDFKKLHPAFSVLTRKHMLEGLSAPIHAGAAKYFTEAGLVMP